MTVGTTLAKQAPTHRSSNTNKPKEEQAMHTPLSDHPSSPPTLVLCFVLCGLVAGLPTQLAAADNTSKSSTAATTPGPQLIVPLPTSPLQMGFTPWGGLWYGGPEWHVSLRHRTEKGTPPQSFSFPVRYPWLGAPLPPAPRGDPGAVAVRLAPYLAEPFFPALSALVHEGALSSRRLELLSRYREQRLQVVKALTVELTEVRSSPGRDLSARLAAFAQTQAGVVSQVEALAEEIRSDLLQGRLLEGFADWEAYRAWVRAVPGWKDSLRAQCEPLLEAAAFEPGLLPEQRELLQDTAMELVGQDAPDNSAGAAGGVPMLAFDPGAARVRLPADLPAELQATVAEYRRLKDALKAELRAAVLSTDRNSAGVRASTLAQLRESQAPRLAELATLAEAIRAGLVGRVLPDEPTDPAVPAGLAAQIADYLQAKVAAQRAFIAKLEEVRAALPQATAEIEACDRGYEIRVAGAPVDAPVLATLPEFHAARARAYAELLAKKKALLQALRATAPRLLEARDCPVDALLQEFAAAQARRDNWNKYWLYRQAVLTPGLSAGQRRLLFRHAVETLLEPYVR